MAAIIAFLVPPIQRPWRGRVSTDWAPIWDIGDASIDVPLLLTELLIIAAVTVAVVYALRNETQSKKSLARSFGFVAIQTVRFLSLLIAIWQLVGFLPMFTWLDNVEAVTANMWAMVAIKSVILVVGLGLFFGLRSVASRLKQRESKQDVAKQKEVHKKKTERVDSSDEEAEVPSGMFGCLVVIVGIGGGMLLILAVAWMGGAFG